VINRFSSRLHPLDRSFLTERLRGAQRHDRIAGFFSSSVLEMAGEELESVAGAVRLVCNSIISADDVATAKKAAQAAMRREWCDAEPERLPEAAKPRFQRLYGFLSAGKLQVRVIPDEKFGGFRGPIPGTGFPAIRRFRGQFTQFWGRFRGQFTQFCSRRFRFRGQFTQFCSPSLNRPPV
jgi:hypothetical protein